MSADWYPGIRSFCSYWSNAPMLLHTYEVLKQTFAEESDGCIDASKAFVECACRIIIDNLDDPKNPIKEWKDSPIKKNTPSFDNWVSAALHLLKLTDGRDDAFNKVLSQHFKLVDALRNFRNIAGPISHGKEGFAHILSAHHRRSAVLAADALVTFLHEAYLEKKADHVPTREPYERLSSFNSVIDRHAGLLARNDEDGLLQVNILLPNGDNIPLTIKPSELLLGVDREAYKQVLNACKDAEAPQTTNDEEAV